MGKIERKEMLTKYEYFHFLETIFCDSSEMFGELTDLVLYDYRTLKSCEQLKSRDNCLVEGLQILVYAKRKELSECKAIIKADSLQNRNIATMILLYDTFYTNSGVKEYLLEKQESPVAKERMLLWYKEYIIRMCERPSHRLREFISDLPNKGEILLCFAHSYLSLFSTNRAAMPLPYLRALVESLEGSFQDFSMDSTSAEINTKLPSLKSSLNLLYEYISSETMDLWKDDQSKEEECKQALDEIMQKSGREFFASSAAFFDKILDSIEKREL